jgi:peptidoglycan/LPS O-acetylase OafA/YrhL
MELKVMQILTKSTSTQKKLRIDYLDGIRGITALYVLLVHINPSSEEPLPLIWGLFSKLLRYGHFSVVIFIVLSGYCLMLPLARNQKDHVNGGFVGYIKRRSRRILPPYYGALALCLILAGGIFLLQHFTNFQWNQIAGDGPFKINFSFKDVLLYLLLIHNLSLDSYHAINPPMWSVATEWQLYFLFPLLLLPIRRSFGLLRAVIAAFIIGLAPLYLFNRAIESASPWFFGLFALGMAAAEISFSQKPRFIKLRNKLPWGSLVIVFTLIAFISEWRQLGLEIWVGHLFLGIAAACLFINCTKDVRKDEKSSLILQILEHPWVIALGTFSYSLYLTHGPIITLVRYFLFYLHLSPGLFAATCYFIGVLVSLIFAYGFYLVFERPFIKSI